MANDAHHGTGVVVSGLWPVVSGRGTGSEGTYHCPLHQRNTPRSEACEPHQTATPFNDCPAILNTFKPSSSSSDIDLNLQGPLHLRQNPRTRQHHKNSTRHHVILR